MTSVVGIVAWCCLLMVAVSYTTVDAYGKHDDIELLGKLKNVKQGHHHIFLCGEDGKRGGKGRRPKEGRRPGRGQRPRKRGQGHRKTDKYNLTRLRPKAQHLISLLSSARNVFTSNLYREIERQQSNVVCSPYSIHQALTMTFLGARTRTAYQMKRTLALQGFAPRVHRASKMLNQLVNKPSNATLESAMAVYVKAKVIPYQRFSDAVSKIYHSNISTFDWEHPGGPEGSINEWVSNHTHALVSSILSPGTVTQDTSMVLVNAIYFKAKWKTPFVKKRTSRQMFSKTEKEQVPVRMMETEGWFKMDVIPGHAARVLELPYEGDRFSMLVILPDDIEGLAPLEKGLTAETLAITLDSTRATKVKVFLPRFKLETSLSLTKSLQDMGMDRAFNATAADFSGIGSNNLYIEDVIHRAVVDVNEEGSEAAGSTAVIINLRRRTPEFLCDHPFLFFIRENASKVNLFVGKFSGGN